MQNIENQQNQSISPILNSTNAILINKTGKFDLNSINKIMFDDSLSTLEQFLERVENNCDNFKTVKRMASITRWILIIMCFTIFTAFPLAIANFVLYSIKHSIVDFWIFGIAIAEVIIFMIFVFIVTRYTKKLLTIAKENYDKIISNIIMEYNGVFNNIRLSVMHSIRISPFHLEIKFISNKAFNQA